MVLSKQIEYKTYSTIDGFQALNNKHSHSFESDILLNAQKQVIIAKGSDRRGQNNIELQLWILALKK